MKKFVVLLAVALMAAPVLAVSFSSTAVDQNVTIKYDLAEGEALRGVALTVELTGGTLQSVDDIVALNSEFNAYIDYYVDNNILVEGATLPGEGAHPLCNPNAAGVAILPNAIFGICMGYLDEDGNETLGQAAPGVDKDLITFTVTCDAEATSVGVAVIADGLRGGIVGDNLTEVVLDPVAFESVSCAAAGHFNEGDANGDNSVDFGDVQSILGFWGKTDAEALAAADVNGDGSVDFGDVQVVLGNWGMSW